MTIMGVDEVGRGCLAGPVVAAAVILASDFTLPGDAEWKLSDSKKLSAMQRVVAYRHIQRIAVSIGVGWVMNDEIDAVGMTESVRRAMAQAVKACGRDADEIILDGSYNYLANLGALPIIRADGSIPAVSAASIVAKVARDRWMQGIAAQYPEYGFDRHVGYGTRQHLEALKSHGICRIHRRSFKPINAMLQ